MHELAVTQSLVETVLCEIEKNNIKNPKKIIVDLGYFTSYVKESILMYYEIISQDFPKLADTVLEINEISGKVKCKKCKTTSVVDDAFMIFCKKCHSSDVEIIQGKEFIIKDIITAE